MLIILGELCVCVCVFCMENPQAPQANRYAAVLVQVSVPPVGNKHVHVLLLRDVRQCPPFREHRCTWKL